MPGLKLDISSFDPKGAISTYSVKSPHLRFGNVRGLIQLGGETLAPVLYTS